MNNVAFILSGFPDKLKYLDKNREKIESVLSENGWKIRSMPFSSLSILLALIAEFKNKKIDNFIFFYTGHGNNLNEDGTLDLVLHDKIPVGIDELNSKYFSKLNIGRKAIVLDACYSGNFKDIKVRDNTEYLCSSDFDEQSFEDEKLENSFFSYYFYEAIIELKKDKITLDLISKYINQKVSKQCSNYSLHKGNKIVITDNSSTNLRGEVKKNKNYEEIFSENLKKYYRNNFNKLKIYNTGVLLDINFYQDLLINYKNNNEELSEIDFFTLINEGRIKYLVKGDIGLGKSTLLQYYCYQWSLLDKKLTKYKAVIYLELRKMNQNIEHITDLVKIQYKGMMNNSFDFDNYLSKNKDEILFIFDGIDEIMSSLCRENFYDIYKFLQNTIVLSRNNSIDINSLYPDKTFEIGGFKNSNDLKNIISKRSIEHSDKEIVNYLKEVFHDKSIEDIFYLIRFFNSDDNLFEMAKNPLIINLLYSQKRFRDLDKFEFFLQIVSILISDYNKLPDRNKIFVFDDINQTKNTKVLEDTVNKILFSIAYISYKKHRDIDKNIIENLDTEQFEYILKFGFLKTDTYTKNIENSIYKFINTIFKNIFIAHHISSLNIADAQRDIDSIVEKIKNNFQKINFNSDRQVYQEIYNSLNKEYVMEILIFLNRLFTNNSHNNISEKISKNILDIIEKINIEIQIEFLDETNVILKNFHQKLKEYQEYIEYQNNIKQKNLNLKLGRIIKNHTL